MPSQQIKQAAISKIQISTLKFQGKWNKKRREIKANGPHARRGHLPPHRTPSIAARGSAWAAATSPIQHLVRQLEGKRVGQTTNNNISVHNTRRSILQGPFHRYDAIFIYARPVCYIKSEDKKWTILGHYFSYVLIKNNKSVPVARGNVVSNKQEVWSMPFTGQASPIQSVRGVVDQ